ncbi:hypothetical protein [Pseudomonas sp.]|uniref:hypothetical protein n=1 Tax=Pseudomonas sp. TaxID=306 RepID=UPI00289B9FAD|nr:hypothetical protein [Pseudomonas sp.]
MSDYSDFADNIGEEQLYYFDVLWKESDVLRQDYIGELTRQIYRMNLTYSDNEDVITPARARYRAKIEKYLSRAKGPAKPALDDEDDYPF